MLDELRSNALQEIAEATDEKHLQQVRVAYLGKTGKLTVQMRTIASLPKADRPAFGASINRLKGEIEEAITFRAASLHDQALTNAAAQDTVDISLPGRRPQNVGTLHPITQTFIQIEDMFVAAGYEVVVGPEIEDEYYNFNALNIPADHPARAMHDTFYLEDGRLLRTHTSPVQVHVMERQPPPIRVICPGRVFRRDFDRTHTPMFHQVEGLVIDKGLGFADLKGTVINFIRSFFADDVEIRFRPSYFPFTEPSAEVDVMGEDGWREVLGCGVVHPKVLEISKIDPIIYSGFAFGFGVDRLAMLKFGISDLRQLFENDVRLLRQTG